tara:strand:- start:1486 stop:2172 length:687 start_codon:yes stop_codon:yes gene_type:complete
LHLTVDLTRLVFIARRGYLLYPGIIATIPQKLMEYPQKFEVGANRKLTILDNEIIYYNGIRTLRTAQPESLRFGPLPIDVYHFRIGYSYRIELMTEHQSLITIPFNTYFGIGRRKTYEKYQDAVDAIWEHSFQKIYEETIEAFNEGMDIIFSDKYTVCGEGLMLTKRNELIPYEEMQIQDRFEDFVVNSKTDPKLYTTVSYLKDWNWMMLHSLLTGILEQTKAHNNSV